MLVSVNWSMHEQPPNIGMQRRLRSASLLFVGIVPAPR
jgi:hypothetical protein